MHIDSEIISNNHLRIYTIQYEDGDGVELMYYCEDLGSTNGTRVNNALIGRNNKPSNPFLLSDGDIITVRPGFSFEFKQPIERQRGEMDAIQLEEMAVGFCRELCSLSNFIRHSRRGIPSPIDFLGVAFTARYIWREK